MSDDHLFDAEVIGGMETRKEFPSSQTLGVSSL